MRQSFGFFPYEAMNYKAGQAYLDRKAAQGWELRHIYLGCIARFEEANAPRHFVDLDIRPFLEEEPDQDYIQLCADAGWEHIQTLRGMLLFRAAPGEDPAPIQSDAGIEWERFWRKYARKNLISSAVVLLLLGGLFALLWGIAPGPGRSLAGLVASNAALLYLLSLAAAVVSTLLEFVSFPLYLLRCRRSGQVETPRRAAAWVQDALFRLYKPFYLIAACVALAEILGAGTTVDLEWYQEHTAATAVCREYPVVLSEDLGLDFEEDDSRWLEGRRSLLAEVLDWSEVVGSSAEGNHHILTSQRYDCANEPLARWVLDQRRRETEKGAFLWGELPWEEAPELGFEEGYTCREGSYLLLRQDDIVALVGCTGLDLTTPENLAVVRERLGL